MSNLEELVTRYGNMKSEMDSYKKQVEADNKEIKEIMSKENRKTCTAGGFTATYTVTTSKEFNNELLVAKLQGMDINGETAESLGIIKYKPVVDMEALETAIYNGKLNATELASCKVETSSARLTIKKEKK